MLNAIDNFYLEKEEPDKSCLLALKEIILSQDPNITAAWKYGMPFFLYKNKMFCYLWVHKTLHQPYIGLMEGRRMQHPELRVEKRSRVKIFLVDAGADLPLDKIKGILKEALSLYSVL